MTERPLTFFHAAQSRSSGVLALLEELDAPYTLKVLNLRKEEHRAPAFLAVNPLGKVPALLDGASVITEQVAIMLHLADTFPAAGLSPSLQDPLRGPYLRWMVFYAAAFEPAIVDKARGHDAGPVAMSPYGSYDAVIAALVAGLQPGPYLLGSTFSAADVLWGSALGWVLNFNLVPKHPILADYAARVADRPAMKRAAEKDRALAAAQSEA